jgi:hypothetical protein
MSFDSNSEAYVWSKPHTKLKGLSKHAKKRFHPWYTRPAGKARKDRVQTSKKVTKGRKGGKMVHMQLEEFVCAAKRGRLMSDLDPRTTSIIKEVQLREWAIFAAEFCVGDKSLRLGTGVDLLCVTPKGEIATIEIKVGFDNVLYSEHTEKRMKKPFDMMDDSPYCQHQLQLLGTVALFEKMTGLTSKHAEVWVIGSPRGNSNSCPISCWPLHPDIIKMSSTMLDLLSNVPSKGKKRIYAKKATQGAKKKQKRGSQTS